jgi:hypothetical protein
VIPNMGGTRCAAQVSVPRARSSAAVEARSTGPSQGRSRPAVPHARDSTRTGGIVRCTARAFRRQAALADHRHACGGLANQTNRPVLPPTQQTVSRLTHHHAPHHDDRDPRANVRSQSLSAHRVPKRSRSLTNAIPTITQRSLVRRRWSQQCLHESSQGAICRLTSQLNWRVRYQAVRRNMRPTHPV